MADHTKFVELAKRLITKSGRAVSLVKLSSAAVDPAMPWKGSSEAAEWTENVKAVFVPAGGGGMGNMGVSEDMLKRVSEVALVAPANRVLSDSTVMLDNGVRKAVEWVQVLQPADQICLYVFGVKR